MGWYSLKATQDKPVYKPIYNQSDVASAPRALFFLILEGANAYTVLAWVKPVDHYFLIQRHTTAVPHQLATFMCSMVCRLRDLPLTAQSYVFYVVLPSSPHTSSLHTRATSLTRWPVNQNPAICAMAQRQILSFALIETTAKHPCHYLLRVTSRRRVRT